MWETHRVDVAARLKCGWVKVEVLKHLKVGVQHVASQLIEIGEKITVTFSTVILCFYLMAKPTGHRTVRVVVVGRGLL